MSPQQSVKTEAYGNWSSPISAATLTSGSVRLSEPRLDGKVAYWLESRPDEGGRNALMRQPLGGEARELLDADASVRTRAHEYGGASYLPTPEAVYAVFDADQRVYKIPLNKGHSMTPAPITPDGAYQYADFNLDEQRSRLIGVREDHTGDGEERAEIVAIDWNGRGEPQVLTSGADFYSNPRVSPEGRELVWLEWNHPNMPWDGTRLQRARFANDGSLENIETVAGGDSESIFQPQWSPSGELFFVSDHSNWWNLYRLHDGKAQCIVEMEAEFATPQWQFGMSTYAFLSNDRLVCAFTQNGRWQLGVASRKKTASGFKFHPLKTPLTEYAALCANEEHFIFLGANAQRASALYHLLSQSIGPKAAPPMQIVKRSQDDLIDPAYLSDPEPVSFDTRDGETAHGFYYAPKNPDFAGPEGEAPPLVVVCHGGPTGATSSGLNYKLQFWSSRGFAVLDVNYRGSTGYGRAYRDKLQGNWGVTDVIDVESGASALVDQGLAHPDKLIIRGSSAGGYTVLAALTFGDTFAMGASLYGVGDLTALAEDTHKFESRYLDTLVGPYPEQKAVYEQRSPVRHIDQLNCPVIFLQGLKDKIVPPAQAEAMVAALDKKGLTNRYVTFENEGHGFRSAESIEAALSEELAFYREQLGVAQ